MASCFFSSRCSVLESLVMLSFCARVKSIEEDSEVVELPKQIDY